MVAVLINSIDFGAAPWLGSFFFPMNKKKDEIIFGAKRTGVTWLHSFPGRAALDSARLSAKRLGSTLSQMLCGPYPKEPENNQRRFTHEDRESHGLKIQITACDELTRRALETPGSLLQM